MTSGREHRREVQESEMRWFGHVKRRDQDYLGRKTLEMVPPGRRKRGRPKQRWIDCVNRDKRAIGTTKFEVQDRIMCCVCQKHKHSWTIYSTGIWSYLYSPIQLHSHSFFRSSDQRDTAVTIHSHAFHSYVEL